MIYIIKNRNFDKHFHDWQTNKDTPYVYNLNSSRKAALNARGGERGGRNLRLCPERLSFKSWGHFTWRRLTFTVKSRPYPVAYHLPQWHLGDLRFCRPQNLFSCRPCCSCFGPLGRESANPPIQRRPRIGACCIPSLGSLASRDLIGPVVFSTVTFRGTSKCPIPARRTFFWPISYRDKRNAWFRFSFCCKILKFLHSSVLKTRADLFNLPVSIGRNLEENLYWYFETK